MIEQGHAFGGIWDEGIIADSKLIKVKLYKTKCIFLITSWLERRGVFQTLDEANEDSHELEQQSMKCAVSSEMTYNDNMNNDLLNKALEVAKQAAQETGHMLLPYYGNIKAKAESDKAGDSIAGVFTELDEKAERLLQERLGHFSAETGLDVGFTGEQYGEQHAEDVSWLVDPIDGTTHFIRGLPMCTVMIALVKRGEVLLAVIHDIANQETYWAARGQGAFRGGKKLTASQRGLKKSLVCFESKLENSENMKKYMQIRRHTVTMIGLCSGYEFIMIASGKLDGKVCLEPYGKDWDFAPGSLLVQEAGGMVSNIGRADYDYRNHDSIIAGEVLYRELTDGPEAIFPIG